MLCAVLPYHLECLYRVRSRSGQPCSLCRAGDLRVHATARSIHIQLRVAVLRNSPRPASVRSATAPTATAHVTLVVFGGTTFVFLRARRPATARSRLASRALHPPSAARYVVGGIPPSLSRLHLAAQFANRPRGSRSCSPPPPRSRLHLGSGAFFFDPFARRRPWPTPLSF